MTENVFRLPTTDQSASNSHTRKTQNVAVQSVRTKTECKSQSRRVRWEQEKVHNPRSGSCMEIGKAEIERLEIEWLGEEL